MSDIGFGIVAQQRCSSTEIGLVSAALVRSLLPAAHAQEKGASELVIRHRCCSPSPKVCETKGPQVRRNKGKLRMAADAVAQLDSRANFALRSKCQTGKSNKNRRDDAESVSLLGVMDGSFHATHALHCTAQRSALATADASQEKPTTKCTAYLGANHRASQSDPLALSASFEPRTGCTRATEQAQDGAMSWSVSWLETDLWGKFDQSEQEQPGHQRAVDALSPGDRQLHRSCVCLQSPALHVGRPRTAGYSTQGAASEARRIAVDPVDPSYADSLLRHD